MMRYKQDLDPEFIGTCSEFNTWEGSENILLRLIENVLMGLSVVGVHPIIRLNQPNT